MITICLENNTGISFYNKSVIEDLESLQRKTDISHQVLHPPPSFHSLKEIFCCPSDKNLFFMYTNEGMICKSRRMENALKLEEVFQPSKIKVILLIWEESLWTINNRFKILFLRFQCSQISLLMLTLSFRLRPVRRLALTLYLSGS